MDNLLKDHRCPIFAALFAAKVGIRALYLTTPSSGELAVAYNFFTIRPAR